MSVSLSYIKDKLGIMKGQLLYKGVYTLKPTGQS